jgi:hypothetical protein
VNISNITFGNTALQLVCTTRFILQVPQDPHGRGVIYLTALSAALNRERGMVR